MRLKKITLHNFRCFEKLEVDLHPRLTVIVGENGAGKTAVLDGIASALSPVLTYLSSANQRLIGRGIQDRDFTILPPIPGGFWRNKADVTQLEVETTAGLEWDVWRASRTRKKPAHVTGQAELKQRLESLADSYVTPFPQPTPVIAYYGAGRGYVEVPRRLRRTKINYDYPASALVDALDSFGNFREVLAWFDREEVSELRQNRGAPITDIIPSHTLSGVRKAISELLRGNYTNPHFNDLHKFVIQRKADGLDLLVDELSQGYQSMLALAMDFSRRLAIADRKGTETNHAPAIMLVDEIDIHLHPTWQQRVLDDLLRTFPKTQFIVTTHSPQVLTSVDKECIRMLRKETNEVTERTELKIRHVEYQTRGVASADLLARIMGTDPVPDVPEAHWVSDYHALIQENLYQEPKGMALREKLELHFGEQHPVIREFDRMIRLQEFKQRLPRDLGNK